MKKKKPEKTGKNQKKDTKFKKGVSGNPAGKPKGTKSFSTLFKKAIRKIAKDKGTKVSEVERAIVIKACQEAEKGNFSFYKDIMDRVFGKSQDKIDVTSKGEKITGFDIIKPNEKTN